MRVSRGRQQFFHKRTLQRKMKERRTKKRGRTVFLFLWQKEEEEAKKGFKSGGRGSLRPSLSTARKRRLWKNRRGGERERGGSNFWPKRGRRREGKDRTQNKWHFFPGKLLGFPFLLDAAAAPAPFPSSDSPFEIRKPV